MKKLVVIFGALLLAACSSETNTTTENEENNVVAEETTNIDETNEGDSLIAEDTFESEESLPGSLDLVQDMLNWKSYGVSFGAIKQTESEELIDVQTDMNISYDKEKSEIYIDYQSIGFNNTTYEIYANEKEGFINRSLNGWEPLEDYQSRLKDSMPTRVKLLEMLTLASTYKDQDPIDQDGVKDLYEIKEEMVVDVYKNIDAYLVYGMLFNELSNDEKDIVNDTVLPNIKSGDFYLNYDKNAQLLGFDVVIAFNESDPLNEENNDFFVITEVYSNINNVEINRPEGL